MTVPLGNPFALGNTGVQTAARIDRIAMGASFLPGAAAVSARSGVLAGPPNTMGELTLLTDVLLRVAPFIAVIQGTHAANQGQYVVPNDTQRDLAVPAKDASQSRKVLVQVRVADSLAAGVASSATTDGSWLELKVGALAASNPALPAVDANSLALGELSIPSTASGLPVTLTKYDPRTTTRGGILPVLSTDTVAGVYDRQYRDHPLYGLQRWNATTATWQAVKSTSADWALVPVAGAPNFAHFQVGSGSTAVAGTSSPPGLQYRREGDRVWLRGYVSSTAGAPVTDHNGGNPLSTALPAEFRPVYEQEVYGFSENYAYLSTSWEVGMRIVMAPNGCLYSQRPIPANTFLNFAGMSYGLG